MVIKISISLADKVYNYLESKRLKAFKETKKKINRSEYIEELLRKQIISEGGEI